MDNTTEEKRVKMNIDVSEEVAEWIRARAKSNLRAMCREVEAVLVDAKRRDDCVAAEAQ